MLSELSGWGMREYVQAADRGVVAATGAGVAAAGGTILARPDLRGRGVGAHYRKIPVFPVRATAGHRVRLSDIIAGYIW